MSKITVTMTHSDTPGTITITCEAPEGTNGRPDDPGLLTIVHKNGDGGVDTYRLRGTRADMPAGITEIALAIMNLGFLARHVGMTIATGVKEGTVDAEGNVNVSLVKGLNARDLAAAGRAAQDAADTI